MKRKSSPRILDPKVMRPKDPVLYQGREYIISSRIGAGFYIIPGADLRTEGIYTGLWVARENLSKVISVSVDQIGLFEIT